MGNSVLAFLDEIRTIAQNGLEYTDDPYDQERYERLLNLVSDHYAEITNLPQSEIHSRFADRIGHVTPNVGGRAAVVNDIGQILVMKRTSDGVWGLPGGFAKPRETPAETAVRETEEETGLRVEPVDLVTFQYRDPDKYNPHGFVGAVYLCRIVSGTLEESHESEDLDYKHINHVSEWHKDHEQAAREALALWEENTERPTR